MSQSGEASAAGKANSSLTPLFLPHPSLTLANNHLGASLRSSRDRRWGGGQLLQMFAGNPLRSGVCVILEYALPNVNVCVSVGVCVCLAILILPALSQSITLGVPLPQFQSE